MENKKGPNDLEKLLEQRQEEVVVQCGVCDSQGEINADEVDSIIIDSDGIHRLQ